jgi:thiamine-monophosphate kinase
MMKKSGRIEDEFSLITEMSGGFSLYQKDVLVPNGDDAAIYRPQPGKGQVVCVDTMVEEIHFKRQTMKPYHIGYKSLAVNVSDIAAMGGHPSYFLVSLAVSPDWSTDELVEMYQGMKSLADQWNIDLLGGDTVSIKKSLVVSVTAIGQVDEQVKLLRSNARPGDALFVTGNLGDAAAGLDYLLHSKEGQGQTHGQETEQSLEQVQEQEISTLGILTLVQAHQMPIPHVQQGKILSEFAKDERISLNDVSDGLASEAHEIAASSKVKVVIDKDKLPLSSALLSYAKKRKIDPYHWAFNGGEDFVLVGTLPRHLVSLVQERFQQDGLSLYEIGHVEEGNGEVAVLECGKKTPVHKQGYNHFG